MFTFKRLWLDRDPLAYEQWLDIMRRSKLNSNETVDYTVGVFDGDTLAATGSFEGNIIKCVSVCQDYQSENLLTQVMMHLMERLRDEGEFHYFVYTKPDKRMIFKSLGFKEVIANEDVLFMEFGQPDFDDYLKMLAQYQTAGSASAIVMNANPFTKGHQYLVTYAAEHTEHVYVFVLTEERSEFSAADRLAMVKLGTEHLANVTVLPTKNYMVSSATFPSYFLKDDAELSIARVQASLDARLFKERVAPILKITERFVGDEPYSKVTNVYNESMQAVFGETLKLTILPRVTHADTIISATKVRQAITDNNDVVLRNLLPETSYQYLQAHNKI